MNWKKITINYTTEYLKNRFKINASIINQRKHLVGIEKNENNLFFASCITCLWKGPKRSALTPANDDRKLHINNNNNIKI